MLRADTTPPPSYSALLTDFLSSAPEAKRLGLTQEQALRLMWLLVAKDWLRIERTAEGCTFYLRLGGRDNRSGQLAKDTSMVLNLPSAEARREWEEAVPRATSPVQAAAAAPLPDIPVDPHFFMPEEGPIGALGSEQPDTELAAALRVAVREAHARMDEGVIESLVINRPVTLDDLQVWLGSDSYPLVLRERLVAIITERGRALDDSTGTSEH